MATAGAGALLTIGCSSSSVTGSVVVPPSDASDTDGQTIINGTLPDPDGSLACGTGVCGSVDAPYTVDVGIPPTDASDAASDASSDATLGCHPCGVVVRPDQ